MKSKLNQQEEVDYDSDATVVMAEDASLDLWSPSEAPKLERKVLDNGCGELNMVSTVKKY